MAGPDNPLESFFLQNISSSKGHYNINYVELDYQMLHAKFQDHRTSNSGEEAFERLYGIWAWRPS